MSENIILSRITFLIDKCLNNKATDKERDELFFYLAQEHYKDLLDELIYQSFYVDVELTDLDVANQDAVFESVVQNSVSKNKAISTFIWKWASVAALFIAVFSAIIFYSIKTDSKDDLISSTSKNHYIKKDSFKIDAKVKVAEKPLPAEDQALLTTSDGTSFRLDNLKVGYEKILDGLTMRKKALGEIVFSYPNSSNNNSLPNRIHTITTPRGSKYKITLPDATTVELNANSRLEFPSYFSATDRTVLLSGEAYFDVKSDKSKRFVVKVNSKQEIVVHGTEFNVNAYPETNSIITTLVEGSVNIVTGKHNLFLKPKEQSIMFNDDIQVTPANIDVITAWRNNLFYFIDEPLENVMGQISRWYDVDIFYQDKIPTIKLWGQISRDKNLEDILSILEKTNDVKFKVEGKEVWIMK